MNKSIVFIVDIDNTLIDSREIYDEAYRLTSREVLGKEFIMSKNVDGTPTNKFSKMTNLEILQKRLNQLGITESVEEKKIFFEKFDKQATKLAKKMKINVYQGAAEFLKELATRYKLVVLSTGPRNLQLASLERSGIKRYFDISRSLFLGEFKSKREAIEKISSGNKAEIIVHVGDSPADMRAMKDARLRNVKKMAVGVIVQGFSTKEELILNGADFIIEKYSPDLSKKFITMV